MEVPETRTSDRYFGFGLTAFEIGGCGVPWRNRWFELVGCLGVWGGALHTSVYSLAPVSPGDYPWIAASLTPRLRVLLPAQILVEVGGDAMVPMTRRNFVVEGWSSPVFREPPVTARIFVSLGVHSP
jgi:hypothetical protein